MFIFNILDLMVLDTNLPPTILNMLLSSHNLRWLPWIPHYVHLAAMEEEVRQHKGKQRSNPSSASYSLCDLWQVI